MRRAALIAVALWMLTAPAAHAQCVFGSGQLDNIAPLANGRVRPPWNTIICAVNALETRALQTPRQDTACVSSVTVAAGSVSQVTLTGLAHAFVGNETVVPTFTDDTDPAAVDIDGVATSVNGATSITVTLFNRDSDRAHTGKLCAVVVRP